MSFVIIGRNTCGWCLRSKFLLKEKKEKFIFIDLDKTKDVNIFNKKYKKYIPYTLTTIPKILLIEKNKTKLIGGVELDNSRRFEWCNLEILNPKMVMKMRNMTMKMKLINFSKFY